MRPTGTPVQSCTTDPTPGSATLGRMSGAPPGSSDSCRWSPASSPSNACLSSGVTAAATGAAAAAGGTAAIAGAPTAGGGGGGGAGGPGGRAGGGGRRGDDRFLRLGCLFELAAGSFHRLTALPQPGAN